MRPWCTGLVLLDIGVEGLTCSEEVVGIGFDGVDIAARERAGKGRAKRVGRIGRLEQEAGAAYDGAEAGRRRRLVSRRRRRLEIDELERVDTLQATIGPIGAEARAGDLDKVSD